MSFADYSLSTGWAFGRHDSAEAALAEITGMGFTRIELGSSLSAPRVEAIAKFVDAGAVTVSSLHCPVPRPADILSGETPEPWLSAMDPAERDFAVRLVGDTLDQAVRFGAGAVVVHVGRLRAPAWEPSVALQARIIEALQGGQTLTDAPVAAMVSEMRRLREEAVPAQYPGLFAAMERVAEHAARTGVRVGLETRVGYPELPFGEEYQMLLERFAGSGICYWHDTGHAQSLELEGFGSHEGLLREYGGQALGSHLHDVIYPWPDHQPPGRGIVDFEMVARLLNPRALRVLEMGEYVEPIGPERIVAGVARLEKAFGRG